MTDRDWNRDGRLLTPEDATQAVAAYRTAYSPRRCDSLFRTCIEKHGHPEPIAAVILAALHDLTTEENPAP